MGLDYGEFTGTKTDQQLGTKAVDYWNILRDYCSIQEITRDYIRVHSCLSFCSLSIAHAVTAKKYSRRANNTP